MTSFVLQRLLQLVPILIGMSLAVFLLVHFIPGDPAIVMLGEAYTESRAEEIREELGLNRALPVQFGDWL